MSLRLEALVEAFWVMPPGFSGLHRVAPDGCTDLIFESRRGVCSMQLVGPSTSLIEVPLDPDTEVAGIRFKPWVAPTLFDRRGPRLRNQVIDLPLTAKGARTLAHLEAVAARMLARFEHTSEVRLVKEAASLLGEPGHSLPTVAKALHTSERSLRRAFIETTALGPKALTRFLRLQRALDGLRAGRAPGELAYDLGFADQAHLTREVSHFTGETPRSWRTQVGRILQEVRPGA